MKNTVFCSIPDFFGKGAQAPKPRVLDVDEQEWEDLRQQIAVLNEHPDRALAMFPDMDLSDLIDAIDEMTAQFERSDRFGKLIMGEEI